MPNSYHRDYANAVSNIYQNMGQAQANARLQQGQGWANAFGQIGQDVAAIPGQMQANKDAEAQRQRMAQQDELSDMQMQLAKQNLEKAQREDAEDMVLNQLISTSVDANGKFNPDLFSKNASDLGFGQFIAPTLAEHAKTEAVKLQLQAGRISTAQAERQILANYALNLWQNAFEPKVVQATWAKLKTDGMSDETIARYKAMPTADFVSAVMGLLPKRAPAEEVTLNEGQVRRMPMTTVFGQPILDENGQPRYTEMRGPEKPQTNEQRFAAATTGAERAEIANLMQQEAQAKRAPEKATFEWVTMPDGSMAYKTPEEIRATPGVKRSSDAKPAQAPASVLTELADMATLDDMSKEILLLAEKNGWGGVGGMEAGSISKWAMKNLGVGVPTEQELRSMISNVTATIAKLRGGTAFTPNEQKLLEEYTPTINDDPAMIQSKLKSLQRFISFKRGNLQREFGLTPQPAPSGGGEGPALDEVRTANGETRKWDGTTWVLVK